MNDLIHRQDAIDVVGYEIDDGYNAIVDRIKELPSAGQNCVICEYYTEIETDDGIKGKCTRRTWSDLISRQDAIRWVKTECNPYGKPTLDFESGKKVIKHLKQMPSRLTEYKTFCGVPIKEAARIVQEYNAEPKTGK